jgi:hypothetical protein
VSPAHRQAFKALQGQDFKVARAIRRHLPNLLTYLRHRLTNAGLEGVKRRDPVGEEDSPRLS